MMHSLGIVILFNILSPVFVYKTGKLQRENCGELEKRAYTHNFKLSVHEAIIEQRIQHSV